MRTRPRRLLLAVAAIAVAIGAFMAVVAPLHAQDQAYIGFRFPDGNNATVSGEQVAQGPRQTFFLGKQRKRVSKNGLTLSGALDAAAQQRPDKRISGVGVYALGRPPQPPLYVTEKPDRLIFVSDAGQLKWFLVDDQNRVQARGGGTSVSLEGLPGELLTVKIDAPSDIEADTEAEFTATASDELDGEKLSYRWYVDGGEQIVGRGETFKHTFKKVGSHSLYVDVRGDKGSRGSAELAVDVGKKTPQSSGGSGGSGGTGGGGGSGGSGSGGTTPGGSGGTAPGYTPPSSPPSTSPLPPPSSSPPPSSPGRGPNLDPSAPSGGTTGQRVEGVLVSTSAPPRPGSARPGQSAQARQQQAKKKSDEVDWRLVGGISLTALLVILGAVRERRHIQRLLPHPTPQTS